MLERNKHCDEDKRRDVAARLEQEARREYDKRCLEQHQQIRCEQGRGSPCRELPVPIKAGAGNLPCLKSSNEAVVSAKEGCSGMLAVRSGATCKRGSTSGMLVLKTRNVVHEN